MIILKDDIIKPYHIHIDEMGNHALFITTKGKSEAGKDILTVSTIGHFSSLNNVLKRLVQSKLVRRNQTMSLQEYINNFTAELNKISELLKI